MLEKLYRNFGLCTTKLYILYSLQKLIFTYHFGKSKELQKYSWLFSETCWFIFYDEAHLMDIIIFCLFYFLTPISRGRSLIPLTCRANGELKRTQQKQCAITLWFFAEQGSWYDKIEFDHTCTINSSIIKFKNY